MSLTDLQNEINHLLFLYFTAIGVIQRDASTPDIKQGIQELTTNIKQTKERIDALLQEDIVPPVEDVDEELHCALEEGKRYLDEWFSFLDYVTDYVNNI